jgi:hypothetical protein
VCDRSKITWKLTTEGKLREGAAGNGERNADRIGEDVEYGHQHQHFDQRHLGKKKNDNETFTPDVHLEAVHFPALNVISTSVQKAITAHGSWAFLNKKFKFKPVQKLGEYGV